VRAIDALAENPRPRGALPLSRDHSEFRLRVGDFRIVYYIEEDALVVVAIGHRRDVYRRLL
jgi:mRNA interferase RelE/StbE